MTIAHGTLTVLIAVIVSATCYCAFVEMGSLALNQRDWFAEQSSSSLIRLTVHFCEAQITIANGQKFEWELVHFHLNCAR